MARLPIDYGTIPGDNTGAILFNSFENIEFNFIEVYNEKGWGNYADNALTTLTLNAAPKQLTINGLGTENNTDYLPLEIRGTAELWDITNNKILPISLGDSYDVRIDLTVNAKTGGPTNMDVILDIGGTPGPTNTIATIPVALNRATPFNISLVLPLFCLDDFLANGGAIFGSVDIGTVDITKREIFIKRNYKGDL